MADDFGKQSLTAIKSIAIPGSLWRHRKGGLYRLVLVAIRESDKQPEVVYRDCSSGTVYSRPADEFLDGRFELIDITERQRRREPDPAYR